MRYAVKLLTCSHLKTQGAGQLPSKITLWLSASHSSLLVTGWWPLLLTLGFSPPSCSPHGSCSPRIETQKRLEEGGCQTDPQDLCNLNISSLLPYSIGHMNQFLYSVDKDYAINVKRECEDHEKVIIWILY